MQEKHPVVLLLVEGWGIAPATDANAITCAEPETYAQLINSYPAFALSASGLDVGLKANEPGNYQAGYKTIGNPLTEAIENLNLNILAIASTAGIDRLQSSFFTKPLSPQKITEVSGDQETDEIIRNVMDSLTEAVLEEKADLIVGNLIHIDDSASHGNLATTIQDIKVFDEKLKSLVEAVLTKHATLIFVSSHGNAEAVIDLTTDTTIGNTTNPVPCIVVNEYLLGRSGGYDDSVTNDLSKINISGTLELVAPTVIKMLGLGTQVNLKESLVN